MKQSKLSAVTTASIPGGARRRVRTFALLLALPALLVGCGSAPPLRFHSLLPAEPPAPQARGAAAPLTIALAPIELPAQVDQPQWVVRLGDGSLAVLEQERWVAPLRDELRQALLERLAARSGIIEARNAPTLPSYRVAIQLLRFDSVLGREALLEGQWLMTTTSTPPSMSRCAWTFREAANGGVDSMARAQRAVVAQLGDAIARSLRSGDAACPSP